MSAALVAAGIAASLASVPAQAQEGEQRDLTGMDVIGNRELPKALYIVPWQRSAPGDAIPAPDSLLAGQELGPLDPEVFRRELRYHEELQQAR